MTVFFKEIVPDDAQDHDFRVVRVRDDTVISVIRSGMHRWRIAFDLNSVTGFLSDFLIKFENKEAISEKDSRQQVIG